MAVTTRFNRALRNLMEKFGRHADASRSVESVPELARRRADLEDARVDMKVQRDIDGLTGAKPRRSPRWVDPSNK